MQVDNKYSIGYEHGINQARPIVDLEHRVKDVENRVKILSWGGAALAAVSLASLFLKLPKLFKGKDKDKESDYSKGRKDNEGHGNGTMTDQKFRRHARAF